VEQRKKKKRRRAAATRKTFVLQNGGSTKRACDWVPRASVGRKIIPQKIRFWRRRISVQQPILSNSTIVNLYLKPLNMMAVHLHFRYSKSLSAVWFRLDFPRIGKNGHLVGSHKENIQQTFWSK
jgi:hypothetical protein